MLVLFFFKQKTAYEMRISDWSSDVCLPISRNIFRPGDVPPELIADGRSRTQAMLRSVMGEDCPPDALRAYQVLTGLSSHSFSAMRDLLGQIGRASCRERVCQYV